MNVTIADYKKNPHSLDLESRSKKTKERIDQIQKWLGFSDDFKAEWQSLSKSFLYWAMEQAKKDKLGGENGNARGNFPGLWKRFREECEMSDEVEWS